MKWKRRICLIFLACAVFFLTACGASDSSVTVSGEENPSSGQGERDNTPNFLSPSLEGDSFVEENQAVVNLSHTSDGYVIAEYTGNAPKAKVQITTPNQVVYTYTLQNGSNVLPLTEGNGSYQIGFYEQVVGNQYAVLLKETVEVSLKDEFAPFLTPNQYVFFTAESAVVQKASELSQGVSSDLDVVANVYHYITETVVYDDQKAELVSEGKLTGYLPDVDEVLSSRKGICFDYAALMTAMLRSQGIPTRMEIGYSGEAYHAWISTYIQEIGWIDNMIEFDGKSWKLMDPTYVASSGGGKAVMKYIGDGSHYVTQFIY